jgi:hypothetical protein
VDFAADLPGAYGALGETVTVSGSPVAAIFDGGFIDAGGYGVAATRPSIRCIASDVAAVAVGATVVRLGITYKVRGIEPVAPLEQETRLVLERQP